MWAARAWVGGVCVVGWGKGSKTEGNGSTDRLPPLKLTRHINGGHRRVELLGPVTEMVLESSRSYRSGRGTAPRGSPPRPSNWATRGSKAHKPLDQAAPWFPHGFKCSSEVWCTVYEGGADVGQSWACGGLVERVQNSRKLFQAPLAITETHEARKRRTQGRRTARTGY